MSVAATRRARLCKLFARRLFCSLPPAANGLRADEMQGVTMSEGIFDRWTNADAAENQFREAVEEVFGDRCKAAWLSGSFLYRGAKQGRSDIDIVVVLQDNETIPAGQATLKRI